ANIYSKQDAYWNMYSSLYGEQRALNAKGDPLEAKDIISNWDAKKAANKVVDDAVAKQKELITKANNLSDKDKQALNDQMDAAANTDKNAIDAATTNDGATKAGQDGKTAIEAVTVPTDSDVKKNANSDLDTTADAAKKAIDKTSGLTADQKQAAKDQIDQAVTAAKDNIKNA